MKNNRIVDLIKAGYTAIEISEMTGKVTSGIYSTAKRHGLELSKKPKKEIKTKRCAQCGKDLTLKRTSRRTLCDECIKKNAVNDLDTVSSLVEERLPGWEYIGGYSGTDGSAVIRHECGYTARKSWVAIRHGEVRCWLCHKKELEEDRKSKEEAKRKAEEVKRFYRKIPKYEQRSAKICPVCGSFFLGRKFCSNKCAAESEKHRQNMKKRRRTKKAKTAESSSISLPKLYERDKGICWICGEMCDYEADSNSNYYPSIDHVIPIARGGLDKWDNIKLAHRLCNSQRGNSPL